MKTSNKIWIDVTELMGWIGPVTGIQRVNLCYALYAILLYPQVEVVSYDRLTQKYKILNKGQFIARFSHHVEDESFNKLKANFYFDPIYILRLFISNIKNRVPIRWRAPLLRIKKKTDYIRDFFIRTFNSMNQLEAPFSEDEILLVLGSSWGKERLHMILPKLKSKYKVKIAHIVFDLIPIVHPEFFEKDFTHYFENQMVKTIQISDVLLSISKSTQKDLIDFCESKKLGTKKYFICRLGDDISHFKHTTAVSNLLHSRFVLTVGTLEIRKNHQILIDAWAELYKKFQTRLPKLVIVGRHGWLVDDLAHKIENDPLFKSCITWLKDASDTELAWLYKNCLFTVYPSHYEGWGLPVAESLAIGKYCIASNSSSIPEIGGDLLDYISPNNLNDLVKKISDFIQNPELLRAKEEKIKTNYKPVSWSLSTIELITQIQKDLG